LAVLDLAAALEDAMEHLDAPAAMHTIGFARRRPPGWRPPGRGQARVARCSATAIPAVP
jgi:hypothetical protein